eukprot:CAMPEP_0204119582 /NCGR_PEP_ID=MMETSP0361-20130328/7188_1 /ASSEMBLY_ACC=CAM_ASM_000343 /TAXON_ID=268821 /ORGANISM="Scrippsiella Hangoei, Strain SHTV-5" /LENGTH=50 /DNA_ID=CAMNT_0051070729 /DNA_START=265 /DNA_END=414 /DNA_ORIENTATION=+
MVPKRRSNDILAALICQRFPVDRAAQCFVLLGCAQQRPKIKGGAEAETAM